MARSVSKRGHHKAEVQQVNRTAIYVGGGAAAVILLVMMASFFMK